MFKYTPTKLKEKVVEYFSYCEKKQCFPDEAGMLNWLDVSDKEYEAMWKKSGYSDILLYAKRFRTSWLERKMVEDRASASGCMNALKQEKNGAYSEKTIEKKQDRKLVVKLEGLETITK